MADGPVADAEAFCRTLEAIARTLPRVEFAAHPALRANSRGVDGGAPAVGTDMRAARAFEAVVAGDTSADRPAMTTWYSAGKRHLHQPQLESLAELIAPMVAAAEPPPMTDPRKADGSDARGGAGRGRRAVLELGAGRAVLGRVVSTITGAPLIAVDRRVPKEARVDDDEDWDDDERHRPTLPDDDDADDDDGEEIEEGVAVVSDIASSSFAFAGPARRLVADLTGCSFASLAERANLADVGVGAAVVAKHLCAGATDAAVRLAIEARGGRARVTDRSRTLASSAWRWLRAAIPRLATTSTSGRIGWSGGGGRVRRGRGGSAPGGSRRCSRSWRSRRNGSGRRTRR